MSIMLGTERQYRRRTDAGVDGSVSGDPRFAKLGHRSVVDLAAVWRDRRAACFAEVAGVAEVLAGGPIRRGLQAHLTVLRVAGTGAYAGVAAGADEWPWRLRH
jgi:hypothetical protein